MQFPRRIGPLHADRARISHLLPYRVRCARPAGKHHVQEPHGLSQRLERRATHRKAAVRPREQHPAFFFCGEFRKPRKRSGCKKRMQVRVPEIQQVQKLPAVDFARIEIEGRCQRVGNAALHSRRPARRRRQKGIANGTKRPPLSLRQFHRNPTRAESNSLPAGCVAPGRAGWLAEPAAAGACPGFSRPRGSCCTLLRALAENSGSTLVPWCHMKRIAFVLTFPLVLVSLCAQEKKPEAAKPATPPPVVSPEVHSDNRVVFRLRAPNAREVTVSIEGAPQPRPMQKDDQGVWSVTSDPLAPDFYGYSFQVDGVTNFDPSNHAIKPNFLYRASVVHVPGPGLVWETGDVPHGELHHHLYRSGVVSDDRDYYVYTPAHYDPRAMPTYPVLYLLH